MSTWLDMSEKNPADFVTDRKVRYRLSKQSRGLLSKKKIFLEIKRENRNDNLTETAKESEYTAV